MDKQLSQENIKDVKHTEYKLLSTYKIEVSPFFEYVGYPSKEVIGTHVVLTVECTCGITHTISWNY